MMRDHVDGVFERTEASSPGETISPTLYNLLIGLVVCWGLIINWMMATTIPPTLFLEINVFLLTGGVLGAAFLGAIIYTKSPNYLISFFGYHLVIGAFGVLVSIACYATDTAAITNAITLTIIITIGMMVIGSTNPEFFMGIERLLATSLISLVAIELALYFIFGVQHGLIDILIATVFSAYIAYDWGRANRIPKTLDNAIDSAAAIYIDVIGLFLKILKLMKK